MAADQETLAMHNGQPLLGEAGMDAVRGLLRAHIDYDAAEELHSDEIDGLDQQIKELEERRNTLVSEREEARSTHHSARHTYTGRVRQAVSEPGKKDDPVYAAVLRSIDSDRQNRLWYPQGLEAADQIGRSFVELDRELRSTRRSQPALIVERERGDHTNIYLARTKRRGAGLQPTTVSMEERRGHSLYVVDRVALAVPVNERKITALQVHPNSLHRRESLADCAYEKGPHLRDNVADAFKIILPRGHVWSADILGSYDSGDLMADVWSGNDELSPSSSIELAIGELSVTKALERLMSEFVAKDRGRPLNCKPSFDLLTKIALGQAEVPRPGQPPQTMKVGTNFSSP